MRINQKAITCNKYDEDSSILEQKLSKNCKLKRLETSTIGKLFSEGVEKTIMMSHYYVIHQQIIDLKQPPLTQKLIPELRLLVYRNDV